MYLPDGDTWQSKALSAIEALENLRAMGQRSWLALLGIIVGSASVVALLDIGRSAAEETMSAFKGLGGDIIVASFQGGLIVWVAFAKKTRQPFLGSVTARGGLAGVCQPLRYVNQLSGYQCRSVGNRY